MKKVLVVLLAAAVSTLFVAGAQAYPGPDSIGFYTSVDAVGLPGTNADWDVATPYTPFNAYLCLTNLSTRDVQICLGSALGEAVERSLSLRNLSQCGRLLRIRSSASGEAVVGLGQLIVQGGRLELKRLGHHGHIGQVSDLIVGTLSLIADDSSSIHVGLGNLQLILTGAIKQLLIGGLRAVEQRLSSGHVTGAGLGLCSI